MARLDAISKARNEARRAAEEQRRAAEEQKQKEAALLVAAQEAQRVAARVAQRPALGELMCGQGCLAALGLILAVWQWHGLQCTLTALAWWSGCTTPQLKPPTTCHPACSH